MALSLILLALSGAASHVTSTPGLCQKARLALSLAYLFGKEIIGIAAILPWASRSYLVYSSLPSYPAQLTAVYRSNNGVPASRTRPKFKASVARNIRYGDAERNLLDVYVPQSASPEQQLPVIMFVHGGIWASGCKEIFAQVGATFADCGIVAVVIQYTLFPEVLASEQVREVSKALSWVLDNVASYGGDSRRVTLMGHSAGGHLAAMVLWERLCNQREAAKIARDDAATVDCRQPKNFIGLSGVYDIVEHREHERRRGVESMSCMAPAMGGGSFLEVMSPTRLLGKFLKEQQQQQSSRFSFLPKDEREDDDTEEKDDEWKHASKDARVVFPRCTFFSSSNDCVVPPDTSFSLHFVLQQLGVESRVVLFEHLQHHDFVVVDGKGAELESLSGEILTILATGA